MYLFFAQVARHEIRSQEIREEAREDDPESHDSADEDGPAAKVHVQVRPGSGRGVVLGWNGKNVLLKEDTYVYVPWSYSYF